MIKFLRRNTYFHSWDLFTFWFGCASFCCLLKYLKCYQSRNVNTATEKKRKKVKYHKQFRGTWPIFPLNVTPSTRNRKRQTEEIANANQSFNSSYRIVCVYCSFLNFGMKKTLTKLDEEIRDKVKLIRLRVNPLIWINSTVLNKVNLRKSNKQWNGCLSGEKLITTRQ